MRLIQQLSMREGKMLLYLMRQQESRGRRNWLKLKNIIRSGTLASKDRQPKYRLFQKHIQHASDHVLTTYSSQDAKLLQKSPLPMYKDLLHFQGDVDATGQWVWEAQELAAYFFLRTGQAVIADVLMQRGGQSGDLKILELGAGSSGLAGLALLHVALQLKGVQAGLRLTDGEDNNIVFLRQNLVLNMGQSKCNSASKLLWGGIEVFQNMSLPLQSKTIFDIIILCDCLYFVAFHKQLLLTIDSYLSINGSAFFVNPARGESMNNFLELSVTGGFKWEIVKFEDEKFQMQSQRVRKDPTFDEDKHAPFFIRLFRKK